MVLKLRMARTITQVISFIRRRKIQYFIIFKYRTDEKQKIKKYIFVRVSFLANTLHKNAESQI